MAEKNVDLELHAHHQPIYPPTSNRGQLVKEHFAFSNLFVRNLKIGDNTNPPKALSYKVLSPASPKHC